MRLWLLTSETPFFNAGGIARYVDNFARAMGAAGHDVTVVSRAAEAADTILSPGYRYLGYVPTIDRPHEGAPTGPADRHPQWPYNILDYWTALSYELAEIVGELAAREGPPDVIECQEYNGLGYYVQQRQLTDKAYLPGVPITINLHSPDFLLATQNEMSAYQFPAYWHGRMEIASILAAHDRIAPSAYLAHEVEAYLDDEGVRITPMPLPWTPVEEPDFSIPLDSRQVVYLGRLEVRKGVLDLLKRCEKLWAQDAHFTLTMLGGDTPYPAKNTTVRQYIEQRYAHRLEAKQLVLTGNLPHAEVLAQVRTAGTVVIPSRWENWPNTCIEAMSLGKVVVASRHGGQAEMIGNDGDAGFLFSWEDPQSFDEVFQEALELSPSARERMGRTARQRIAALCDPSVVIPARIARFEATIAQKQARTTFPFVNDELRRSRALQSLPKSSELDDLVSVVVPYYNLGRYLESTLESILASDWPSLEVIIVNDGSTEAESLDVLKKIEARGDDRIRILHIANGGLANARNTGAEASRGSFLCWVDADDQLEPTFIRRSVEVIRRYTNVQIVFSWERYFDASEDIYPGWNFEFPYLLAHNVTCPMSVVVKEAYLRYGRQKPKMVYNFEDYESWIAMVAAGCGGVCLPEPLVRYRIRRDGLWQGSNRQQHLYLYELIQREHPELYQKYGVELFALQNANGSAQTWIKPAAEAPFDAFQNYAHRRLDELGRESYTRQHAITSLQKDLQAKDAYIANLQEENAWRKDVMERLKSEKETLNAHLAAYAKS